MSDKELQVINNNFPTQIELQSVALIARTAHASSMYSGVGGEANIMMILLAAKELGVGPCQALNGGIWSIQGKIEISARLMNGLIRRAGHSIKIIKSDDTICTLLGTRTDGDSFECTFSMEDAIKAGLAGSNVWKKYPGDMLYNRCMSRLARRLFSDVIGQCYVEGEIKEAKDVERYEMAECEDVTKPTESMQKTECKAALQDNCSNYQSATENYQIGSCIDANQVLALEQEIAKQHENVKVWFHNGMVKKGISSIKEIPQDKYLAFMNYINILKNDHENKQKVAS